MSGALAFFVLTALAVRALNAFATPFEIGFLRTSIGLALLLIALAARPSLCAQVSDADPLLHAVRNGIHAIGGVFWTMAIAALPFATVFALEFTAPAWVAILAYPLLGERVRRQAIVGIGVCTIGVLVILRPGLVAWDVSVVVALAAAFCFGVSVVLTRKLTRSQGVFSIMLWMMVLQTVFYAAACVTALIDRPWPDWPPAALLPAVGLGVCGLGSQLCLAKALSHGEAATVIPLDFLRVPLIAGVGALFYGEALDLWVLGGAALIMVGICYGLLPGKPRMHVAGSPKISSAAKDLAPGAGAPA
jgi:drug/metabolite transporter (DMT)-like permease